MKTTAIIAFSTAFLGLVDGIPFTSHTGVMSIDRRDGQNGACNNQFLTTGSFYVAVDPIYNPQCLQNVFINFGGKRAIAPVWDLCNNCVRVIWRTIQYAFTYLYYRGPTAFKSAKLCLSS